MGPHSGREPAATRGKQRSPVVNEFPGHNPLWPSVAATELARLSLARTGSDESLGAAPWAERARLELRASGQAARRRDPSTLLQLTPQELQVARFVAQGLPTREVAAQLFLSPRTVEFHLRNIFAKLGISSRSQLAQFPLD
jgi:DNA-binding CsgD family transcriptional regulator